LPKAGSQGTAPVSGVWGLLVAGGSSQRFGANNKLLCLLSAPDGEPYPVLAWSLGGLLAHPSLQGVVVVAHPQHQLEYEALAKAQAERWGKPVLFTAGGATRQASVWAGLQCLANATPKPSVVVVQDAARPFVPHAWLSEALTTLEQGGGVGVIAGNPVSDTLKRSDFSHPPSQPTHISGTVERQGLWAVQTPQCFVWEALYTAHQQAPSTRAASDDAQLLEWAGLGPCLLQEGPRWNIKLTTADDVPLAQALVTCGAVSLPQ
jgi:2-C-methyl-D-erythritol 4-phosphate cytidylyltransferase